MNGFRLAEQSLSPGGEDVREVVHAAGWLPTRESAYLALRARVPGFTRRRLDDPVFREKSLVEVGSVRGESFLVPREMVPAALRCPAPSLRDAAEQILARAGMPEAGRPHLFDAVRGALAESARPLPDLLAAVSAGAGAPARFLGMPGVLPAVLNLLRLDGEVVRTRLEAPLDDGPPVYALTAQVFPDLAVSDLAPADALKILCAYYFRVHGPATRADFGWWCGAGPAEVGAAFEACRPSFVPVELEGLASRFWMPATRLEALRANERPGAEPVILVPFLDPWLTSHEGRAGRFVRQEDLARAVPGPAVPAILYGGFAVGRWWYDRSEREVRLAWFRTPSEGLGERAARVAAELGAFIRAELPGLSPFSIPSPEGTVPVYE